MCTVEIEEKRYGEFLSDEASLAGKVEKMGMGKGKIMGVSEFGGCWFLF